MKTGNEITASIILNQFFDNLFFYLKDLDKLADEIFKLSNDQIYELHKLATDGIKNSEYKTNNPSKFNICLNICVLCTRMAKTIEKSNLT